MTMIERVARHLRDRYESEHALPYLADGAAIERAFVDEARAIIALMREATPMMANAATAGETDAGGYVSVNDVHGIWQAMIDAALAEKP